MLTFLNQKFKFLLFFILGVVGVSFIFFGNWTPRGAIRSGNVAVINGHEIKASDFEASLQATRVMYILSSGRDIPNSTKVERWLTGQTLQGLVILDAAHRAGLTILPKEVVDNLTSNPLFQENGKYSPTRFDLFNRTILQPRGISTSRLQEIITDSLLIQHMVEAVGATTVVMPVESDETLNRIYGKASLQAVEITEASIRETIKPTEQDLQTFYQAKPGTYADPEKREVEYVKFSLDPKDAALKDQARQQALRRLFDKAYAFTNTFFQAYESRQALPDFKQNAALAGLEVKSAPVFAKGDTLIDPAKGKELAELAFSLNPEHPVSDYQEVSDGFIVLHLLHVQPSQAKPLAAVHKQVEEEYINYVTRGRLGEQAQTVAQALRQGLASGKTWDQAVASVGLKSKSLPAVVPADVKDNKNPADQALYYWANELAVGAVSEPTPGPGGATVYHLAAREKPAESQRAELRPAILKQIEQTRRTQILNDWISSLLKQEKTSIPSNIFGQESPNS